MTRAMIANAFLSVDDHPFSLPASFVAMSKKEELVYKLGEKFMPRKRFAN